MFISNLPSSQLQLCVARCTCGCSEPPMCTCPDGRHNARLCTSRSGVNLVQQSIALAKCFASLPQTNRRVIGSIGKRLSMLPSGRRVLRARRGLECGDSYPDPWPGGVTATPLCVALVWTAGVTVTGCGCDAAGDGWCCRQRCDRHQVHGHRDATTMPPKRLATTRHTRRHSMSALARPCASLPSGHQPDVHTRSATRWRASTHGRSVGELPGSGGEGSRRRGPPSKSHHLTVREREI